MLSQPDGEGTGTLYNETQGDSDRNGGPFSGSMYVCVPKRVIVSRADVGLSFTFIGIQEALSKHPRQTNIRAIFFLSPTGPEDFQLTDILTSELESSYDDTLLNYTNLEEKIGLRMGN